MQEKQDPRTIIAVNIKHLAKHGIYGNPAESLLKLNTNKSIWITYLFVK